MIYIVEDDASIRELEQYALQSNGYEVQGFESAEPFWQAMRAAEPELVILDVMLPGEDGFSILKKLRNTPSLRKLPIIMVTAKSSELDTVTIMMGSLTAAQTTTLQSPLASWNFSAGCGWRCGALPRRQGRTCWFFTRSSWITPATASQ